MLAARRDLLNWTRLGIQAIGLPIIVACSKSDPGPERPSALLEWHRSQVSHCLVRQEGNEAGLT